MNANKERSYHYFYSLWVFYHSFCCFPEFQLLNKLARLHFIVVQIAKFNIAFRSIPIIFTKK